MSIKQIEQVSIFVLPKGGNLMKILLLGATGMTGSVFAKKLSQRGGSVIGVARSGVDISCELSDERQVTELLRSGGYDAVINAAAQVDINRCETDPVESWRINAKLVSILANLSQDIGFPVLQISTDHYYIHGENYSHKETDPVYLVNEYARHKYAAEHFALANSNSLVLRTSLLGVRGAGARSLIEWAVDSLVQKESINLFNDAWTSSIDVPTFVDIALSLFFDVGYRGLVNVGSREVFSKENLIRKLADLLNLDHSNCESRSVDMLSNRANCLGLDVSKCEKLLAQKMPSMEEVCLSLIQNYPLIGRT